MNECVVSDSIPLQSIVKGVAGDLMLSVDAILMGVGNYERGNSVKTLAFRSVCWDGVENGGAKKINRAIIFLLSDFFGTFRFYTSK